MNFKNSVKLGGAVAAAAVFVFLMPLACVQAEPDANEADQSGDGCHNVWFHGKGPLTLAERHKLFLNVKPNRNLSEKERDCLFKVADSLIDKQVSSTERYFNALFLGDLEPIRKPRPGNLGMIGDIV